MSDSADPKSQPGDFLHHLDAGPATAGPDQWQQYESYPEPVSVLATAEPPLPTDPKQIRHLQRRAWRWEKFARAVHADLGHFLFSSHEYVRGLVSARNEAQATAYRAQKALAAAEAEIATLRATVAANDYEMGAWAVVEEERRHGK